MPVSCWPGTGPQWGLHILEPTWAQGGCWSKSGVFSPCSVTLKCVSYKRTQTCTLWRKTVTDCEKTWILNGPTWARQTACPKHRRRCLRPGAPCLFCPWTLCQPDEAPAPLLGAVAWFVCLGCAGSWWPGTDLLQMWQEGPPSLAEHRLLVVASPAGEHGLRSCGAWALLLLGMWNLPGPGIELMAPALEGRFLTTGPPGKSRTVFLMHEIKYKTLQRKLIILDNYQSFKKIPFLVLLHRCLLSIDALNKI